MIRSGPLRKKWNNLRLLKQKNSSYKNALTFKKKLKNRFLWTNLTTQSALSAPDTEKVLGKER